MFLFPAVVCLYLVFFFVFYAKYDTPQYYSEKNMNDLALIALKQSYTDAGLEIGLKRLKSDYSNAKIGEKRVTVITIFCDKKFRKMIRIGFIRVAFFQFSGIFSLLFYSTDVFGEIGGGIFLSRVLTVIFGFILLIANFLFIPVAKCFNRKSIFVGGDALLGVLLTGAGICYDLNLGIIASDTLLLLFVLIFGSTVGSVTWMYLAEILNPQILVVVSMYS